MAMDKQNVPIDFKHGIERKGDDRVASPDSLDVLDDCMFDDAETIIARGGLTAATITPTDAASLGAGKRLFPNGDNLIVERATGATRYDAGLNQGIHLVPDAPYPLTDPTIVNSQFLRGECITAPVMGTRARYPTTPPANAPNRSGSYDVAYDGTYSYWAWEEWDPAALLNGVRWCIVRESDRVVIQSGLLQDRTGFNAHYVCPRCIAIGGVGYIYVGRYVAASTQFTIKMIAVAPATVSYTPTEQTVYTSSVGAVAVDRIIFDADYNATANKLMVAVADNNATWDISVLDVSVADGYTVSGTYTKTPTSRSFSLTALVTRNTAANRTYLTAIFVPNVVATQVRAFYRETVVGSTSADTLVSDTAGPAVGRVTAVDRGAANATFELVYDVSQGGAIGTTNASILGALRVASMNKDLSGGTISKKAFSNWMVAGRPVVDAAGRCWMAAMLVSENQPSMYVIDIGWYFSALNTVDTPPLVLARLGYGECGYLRANWVEDQRIPAAFVTSGYTTFPYVRWVADLQVIGPAASGFLALVPSVVVTPEQVARADINTGARLGHAEAAGLTYLAAGCPHIYDGKVIVEENFHHAPDLVAATVAAAGTGIGPFPLGIFSVCFTMQWTDARGQLHESAPSAAREVHTTGPTPNVLAVVMQPPTTKADARLVWWRTTVGGSTFYRALREDGLPSDDPTLVRCDQLYTTGGVLDNEPMPACTGFAVHDERLFLFGVGDGNTYGFTKKYPVGTVPRFNTFFAENVPPDYGKAVGGASTDGKLFVFGEKRIGAIFGEGPNELGEQDGFSPVQTIVSEIGAVWGSPRGFALEPAGVWFLTQLGLRLLGRNGQLARFQDGREVGSEVDSYTAGASVAAVAGGRKQQIRFYLSTGAVMVWDFQWGQWSRFTNHTCVDAVYAGTYYHLTSAPALFYYDETVYKDNVSASVVPYVETPWLHFAGVQGFQRVYRVSVLGNVQAGDTTESQTFTLKAAYNHGALATEVNAVEIAASVTNSHGQLQFQHAFTRQKCESLKFSLSWVGKAAASRLRLSSFSLQVGVKRGMFKMPAASVP